jgi:hypothetical protein
VTLLPENADLSEKNAKNADLSELDFVHLKAGALRRLSTGRRANWRMNHTGRTLVKERKDSFVE